MSYEFDQTTREGILASWLNAGGLRPYEPVCMRRQHSMELCPAELGEKIIYGEKVYGMARDGTIAVIHVYKTAKYALAANYAPTTGCLVGSWLSKRSELHDALSILDESVQRGDVTTFVNLLKGIEWNQRTSDEFIQAIDLALKIGAHLAARELATQGAEIHFDSEELQKYARILAPPQVSRVPVNSRVNIRANSEWLKMNRNRYKGKSIALKDGELLETANSTEELIGKIGATKGTGILVTHLY